MFFTPIDAYWESGYVHLFLSFASARQTFSLRSWVLQNEAKAWTISVIALCVLAKASCSVWDHPSMIPAENQWLFPTCYVLINSWGCCRLFSLQMHFKGDSKFRLLLKQSGPKDFPQHFPASAALLPLSTAGASLTSILSPLTVSHPFFYQREKVSPVVRVNRESSSLVWFEQCIVYLLLIDVNTDIFFIYH